VSSARSSIPRTERRRCVLRRKPVDVNGVVDLPHGGRHHHPLGTHVEAPYHHGTLTKDVTELPADHFIGAGCFVEVKHL